VGGAPEGTVTVGWVPVVPAGERSSAGMGATAPQPPAGDVDVAMFVLDVDDALDWFDGEELQAAKPKAPATPMRAARDQGRRVRDMARDGSGSTPPLGAPSAQLNEMVHSFQRHHRRPSNDGTGARPTTAPASVPHNTGVRPTTAKGASRRRGRHSPQ